jgi:rubrerythrin
MLWAAVFMPPESKNWAKKVKYPKVARKCHKTINRREKWLKKSLKIGEKLSTEAKKCTKKVARNWRKAIYRSGKTHSKSRPKILKNCPPKRQNTLKKSLKSVVKLSTEAVKMH